MPYGSTVNIEIEKKKPNKTKIVTIYCFLYFCKDFLKINCSLILYYDYHMKFKILYGYFFIKKDKKETITKAYWADWQHSGDPW